MWFINKTTGMKWEISDKELIERLSKDNNYEEVIEIEEVEEEVIRWDGEVEEVKVAEEKNETKKTTTKKK